MAMSKCMKESEHEQMKSMRKRKRKRKRKKVDWFFFLPDDILFYILKRVPDAFLRYKVKHVCRRWFDIITNRILLDHASFIIQNDLTVRLVDIRLEEGQGLQVKEKYLEIPPIGTIRFWCNEFLLISCLFRLESLYVLYLITKEGSYLPQCKASCEGHYSYKCGQALYFDRFKGIYKVVHLFMGPPVQCEVLVLRTVIVSGVSSNWKKNPVSVQGRYLHRRIHRTNDLVSLDMVKEEVCQISLPGSCDRGRYVYSFFEMGGFLAFFDGFTHDKAKIWVLKDFHRVTWEKLQSITVDYSYFEKYPRKIGIYRFCGMISKRYIILESRAENGMYSYDVKYGVMKKLDIDIESSDIRRVVPSFQSLAPRLLLSMEAKNHMHVENLTT